MKFVDKLKMENCQLTRCEISGQRETRNFRMCGGLKNTRAGLNCLKMQLHIAEKRVYEESGKRESVE